jgi:hypothetical protein
MHTVCGTVLRTSSPIIRNHADSDRETGTGGNIPLSQAAQQHIRTAQVITQPQKLHSQLLGIVTAVIFQVTGLTSSFVYCIDLQPTGIIHVNLAGVAHHLIIFHVEPANQPTITGVDLCHKKVGSLKHVPFNTNQLFQFITPYSTLNATQLSKGKTKLVTITSLSLPMNSTLKLTYVTEYDRRPHSDT